MAVLVERFRKHARGCERMGAPLYAELMRGMAADWEAGGVVREIFAGWEDASDGDLVQLRFLGGLHRLVLTGRAPSLAPFFHNLGGDRPAAGAWAVAVPVVAAHQEQLRADLQTAPQTNEVGRCAALVTALSAAAQVVRQDRVRLLEVGASAGLNLRVDAYRVGFDGWWWGPESSPVEMADVATGPVAPVKVEIVQRRGCDLNPVDPLSRDGALRLRSFVWPDHVARYQRLDAALRLAADRPVEVDATEATPWLRAQLATVPVDDVVTVVWHSVVWQYLSMAERAAAEGVIDDAATRMPLVHARVEPDGLRRGAYSPLQVTTFVDGRRTDQVVGDVPPHGFPIRLADPRRAPGSR